jgi:hypothetical protein
MSIVIILIGLVALFLAGLFFGYVVYDWFEREFHRLEENSQW